MHSKAPRDGVRCGVYAVGFFDLCGQSNRLLPYVDLDSASKDFGRIQSDFASITTQLVSFRRDIVTFFEAAREIQLTASAPPNAPPEAIELAREFESAEIKLQGFSDTVVVYLPLATSHGRTSLYRLAALIMSVANTMLMTFARGSIVRGAIDATWAMEPFDGEIYGPALMSAYKLECEAGWPRVVLGPGIQSIWKTHFEREVTTPLIAMNHIFARLQQDMAFQDTDGQVAVDYLGESMRGFLGNSLEPGLIDAAFDRLESELQKQLGNATVKSKLQSTLSYFESRVGPLTTERRNRAIDFMKRLHLIDS